MFDLAALKLTAQTVLDESTTGHATGLALELAVFVNSLIDDFGTRVTVPMRGSDGREVRVVVDTDLTEVSVWGARDDCVAQTVWELEDNS